MFDYQDSHGQFFLINQYCLCRPKVRRSRPFVFQPVSQDILDGAFTFCRVNNRAHEEWAALDAREAQGAERGLPSLAQGGHRQAPARTQPRDTEQPWVSIDLRC